MFRKKKNEPQTEMSSREILQEQEIARLSKEIAEIKIVLDSQQTINENLMFSMQSFTNMLANVGDTLKIHQGVLVDLEQHFLEGFEKDLELKTPPKPEKSKLN
jgi:hypothetical protein